MTEGVKVKQRNESSRRAVYAAQVWNRMVWPGRWTDALMAALAALGLLLPKIGWAACKVSMLEMPVTMVGRQPIATVGINGTQVKMLVDSGAFFSFLTDAAAEQLQLPVSRLPRGMAVEGLTGKVAARKTTVKQLQLLKGDIPNVEFVVGGNEPGSGAMGLLGRNLLVFADTEYDLAHGAIRFMFPNDECGDTHMAYWAGEKPVSELELRRDRISQVPAILATGQLNGVDLHLMFDTGAPVTLVSRAAALRSGITEATMKPVAPMGGIGRDVAKAWVAPVRKFELGGEAIENNQLSIVDFDIENADMLLGVDFFLSHRIYISKRQRRMYFTYNGGPVFALNTLDTPQAAVPDLLPATADGAPALDASGYARRGAASAARNDHAGALADLDRACELAPLQAEHFTQRGQVHQALKQWPQALKDFDTAVSLDAGQSEARMQRAWLRSLQGERDSVLNDLQSLHTTLPTQTHLRLQMASLYLGLDLPEQALVQWKLWIPSHPNDAGLEGVLNERCWTRTMLGIELDQALDDCNAALDRQPKNASYLDSRAWLRLRRGELRDALADYERALKIRPELAWSLYGRGIVRIRLGDVEAGRADIAAARKLVPAIDAQARRHGLAAEPMVAPVGQ